MNCKVNISRDRRFEKGIMIHRLRTDLDNSKLNKRPVHIMRLVKIKS